MTEIKLKNTLYTANATTTGGRNGHTKNSTGVINLDLSIPKSMGGPGKENTTTPEDLFAAGYSACFGSACEYVAKSIYKLNPTKIEVNALVTIGNDDAGGFGLSVELKVKLDGLSKEDVQKVIEKAHESVCPYSKAIKGNVKVTLTTV
jgi:Ohr subfamily peroxiredoxin